MKPIVIDCGTGYTKAGFSGDESPRCIFPTVIGSPKPHIQMVGGQNKEFFIGAEAFSKSDFLNLRSPLENGSITSWEDMDKMWHHTFYNELIVNPEEHSVILTEKPLIPRVNQEKIIQIIFETFNVQGYYSGIQAVFSLFSLGRTTGLVWDAGHGLSFSVPVYEGYCLPHAIQRSSVSGLDITNYLLGLIAETGVNTDLIKIKEIQDIKEQYCYVSDDYQSEIQKSNQGKIAQQTIKLPDNITVSLSNQLFSAPEILFSPNKINTPSEGIHQQIHTSLEKCDSDVKLELYSNIVLTGGTSMFKGLSKRMEKEIQAVSTTPSPNVQIIATPERKNSVWLGGSVFGSLEQFSQMIITKGEFKEEGAIIVHYKRYC